MANIYYDETNNTKKIGFSKKGKLRFEEEFEYFFLYSFIQISEDKLIKIQKLEDEYKTLRKILDDNELKTKHLVSKNITMMDKQQIAFYTELFGILENDGNLVNVGFLMKLSPFFLYMQLAKFIKSLNIPHEAFFYSLQKYLSVRRLKETNRLLSSNISMKNVYSQIMKGLMMDKNETPREKEKAVFKNIHGMLKLVKEKDTRTGKTTSLEGDYDTTAMSLLNVLIEKEISNGKLIYDKFQELDELGEKILVKQNGKKGLVAEGQHSKNNIGLRVVDGFIGLLRRLIIDINADNIKARHKFGETNNVNVKTINFINDNKELFSRMRNILSENYGTTFAGKYSDHFRIAIYALNDVGDNGKVDIENILGRFFSEIDDMGF